MKNKRVGLSIILTTFVLVFAALFCGWKALTFYRVDEPATAALNSIEGIEAFELGGDSKSPVIEVTLGEISDLSDFYSEISSALGDVYRSQVTVNLRDKRDAELVEVYRSLQFAIFEAAQTGEFDKMFARAREMKEEFGIDSLDIDIDVCHIYIAMEKGDKQLYEIIPRDSSEKMGLVQVYTPRNSVKLSQLNGTA